MTCVRKQKIVWELTRLPIIDVPTVKWWQRRILLIANAPIVDAQLRDMSQIVFDKTTIHWRHIGSALEVPVPELDECLGVHPHAL